MLSPRLRRGAFSVVRSAVRSVYSVLCLPTCSPPSVVRAPTEPENEQRTTGRKTPNGAGGGDGGADTGLRAARRRLRLGRLRHLGPQLAPPIGHDDDLLFATDQRLDHEKRLAVRRQVVARVPLVPDEV